MYEGIYAPPTAARYLLAARAAERAYPVTSRHLIRWIRKGLAHPNLADVPGRELTIAFHDLVSMRVIAALRAAGVSWPRIYAAETGCAGTPGISGRSPRNSYGPTTRTSWRTLAINSSRPASTDSWPCRSSRTI